MSDSSTDKPGRRKRQWALLLLVLFGVGIVIGIRLGIGIPAAMVTGQLWMAWAMPVALGVGLDLVAIVIGIQFSIWNAAVTTKQKTLATAVVWGLVYAALVLVEKPLWLAAHGLLTWTVGIVAVVITLWIWGKGGGGAQSAE
jgi:hypothetical protein